MFDPTKKGSVTLVGFPSLLFLPVFWRANLPLLALSTF